MSSAPMQPHARCPTLTNVLISGAGSVVSLTPFIHCIVRTLRVVCSREGRGITTSAALNSLSSNSCEGGRQGETGHPEEGGT